jgi:hypothetical protein
VLHFKGMIRPDRAKWRSHPRPPLPKPAAGPVMDLIPTREAALKQWLSDLSVNIASFGCGFALLAAQIAYLERKCAAMRRRIEHGRAKQWITKATAKRAATEKARPARPFANSR